jgi:hypothetical protein
MAALLVEQLTNDPKIGGSNPAPTGMARKLQKEKKTYFLSTQSHGTANNPPKILDIFYSGQQH